MTQRTRLVLALTATFAVLTGGAVSAAPKPVKPAGPVQEVITIQRTAKSGLAALALIGKIKADKVPGFFAIVDRDASGARVDTVLDFNQNSGLTRYGHGQEAPLCDAPIVCSLDTSTDTLTFSITETDDADASYSPWKGVTRFLALRGTKIDLQVAAIGFTVKRHTSSSFARVTRDQADADGVGVEGIGAEVFRSAQLPGGKRGSLALLQLPCDFQGAGAATFSATGDFVPSVVNCTPGEDTTGAYVGIGGVRTYSAQAGLYSRSSNTATQWQVSGAVTGISDTSTRLFVLNY